MMNEEKLKYFVIENAPDVCEGIIRRMEKFHNWKSIGYCTGVKESLACIPVARPHLIFLDWGLNGGSAYEILQSIQNLPGYSPYIIFNTGFQRDNPEIPQEIINKYRVDKYLVKPFWENLRHNLPVYLEEAEARARSGVGKPRTVWIEEQSGNRSAINLEKLICICQHPLQPRTRQFFLFGLNREFHVPLQWQKCYELLRSYQIDFFITKNRSHLVVKTYIEKYEKPYIRLRGFPAKIEIVKENIRAFEDWLDRTT